MDKTPKMMRRDAGPALLLCLSRNQTWLRLCCQGKRRDAAIAARCSIHIWRMIRIPFAWILMSLSPMVTPLDPTAPRPDDLATPGVAQKTSLRISVGMSSWGDSFTQFKLGHTFRHFSYQISASAKSALKRNQLANLPAEQFHQ